MAVVVITGCSSGLGPLTAMRFALRGDRVYATMRNAERGKTLQDDAVADGLDLHVLDLDVTDTASIQAAVDHILEQDGRIDVLVNNAGVVHLGSVELLPDECLRETIETNLYGPVRMIRAVLPTMRAQRSGLIVNVSSAAGVVKGLGTHWSYFASKHGVGVLSDALALEVEPFGIRVLSIEPGMFSTLIMAKGHRTTDPESPYRTLDTAVSSFLDNGIANAADPDTVAQAILDAVENDDGRVHILVGEDAQMFFNQSQSSTDAEMRAFYKQVIGVS